MTKARYQSGCLTLRKRANGAHIWQFRWWEIENGDRVQRSRIVGTVKQYPARREALRAADALRLEINSELPKAVPVTVATLIDRYQGDSYEMGRLAFSTRKSYGTYLQTWIRSKWGEHELQQVRTMAVEQWLRDLPSLAPRSKVHIRNTMHVLFECAVRWELVAANPISRVRQGGSRLADPAVLTPDEFNGLIKHLDAQPLVRTMVILAGCMGLSRSELTGLKWSDFNWTDKSLTVRRGVVHNHVGDTKTYARKKPVPMAVELIEILQQWRGLTAYGSETDWVFASPFMKGTQPVWPDSLLKQIVKPAAKEAGITKRVGWHTFRHSFSTLLRANGTDVKVQQELLRHSNIQTTLNVYTQAVTEQKREAHAKVVGQLLVHEGGRVRVAGGAA
jgi:integrase